MIQHLTLPHDHRPQEQGALPERAVAMLVYEVLRVVRCCHAAGILHGDIKVRPPAQRPDTLQKESHRPLQRVMALGDGRAHRVLP